jgi:type III pantothenate kinase
MDASGQHLGGFILPGVSLSRRALLESTQIPRVEDVQTEDGFGLDTAGAVAIGWRRAIAGVIDFTIAQLNRANDTPALLITGSEAAQLRPVLTRPFTEVPHLVLEGLARYARSE